MNVIKTAFFSTSWLIFGVAALSGSAFAAETAAAKPMVHDMGAHSIEQPSGMKCDHQGGMMKAHMDGMKSDQKDGMKCDHMDGMKCDHMGGMKCDHMGGMKCDHKGGMKCDHMGGMMGGDGTGGMCDHKGGMMGGHPSHMRMVMSLDLNEDQRSKINKLSDELKHNNWATKGLIMDESAKLRDLYAADKRNPSDIGKVYQKIFDLKRKMIEARITTQNRIEEILTPEQRAQLKDMRLKGPMHDHPMH